MKQNTIWTLILVIAVLETIAMGIIEDSANKNTYPKIKMANQGK